MRTKFGSPAFIPDVLSALLSTKVTHAVYDAPDPSLDTITDLTFTPQSGGADLSAIPANLEYFSAPALEDVPAPNYVSIGQLTKLTDVDLPALTNANELDLVTLVALTSVYAPVLATADTLNVANCAALTSITLPAYTGGTGPGASLAIDGCAALTEINVPLIGAQVDTIIFTNNALTETNVNFILVTLNAAGWAGPGKDINLSGGTNAAPTGAGAAAKAAMIGAGATVTTN